MTKNTAPAKKRGLTVLNPKDQFRFSCRSGMDCFTRCCRDITIFLTPYDILRVKNALHLSSEDFLARFTLTMVGATGLPVVALKMQDDDAKSCPFVTDKGCTVYPDRPWACRIYPLQPETTKITEKVGKAYYSVLDVPFCHGLKADRVQSVSDWINEQGVPDYQEMEAPFKKITTNERLIHEKITNSKIQEIYYMACYDLDRFRRFVLDSTFLKRFDVSPEAVEDLKTDDVALYRFAIKWLEYGLLAQHVLKVKPDVIAARKQELGIE